MYNATTPVLRRNCVYCLGEMVKETLCDNRLQKRAIYGKLGDNTGNIPGDTAALEVRGK